MSYRQLERLVLTAFVLSMLALAAIHTVGVYRAVNASVQRRLTVLP
jgi:hypothetical protein